MRVVAVTIAFGLLSSHLRASSPLSKCFDGDSDSLFTITSPMPLESRMPEIESDSGGRPAKLIWSPAPADTSMTMEQIGRCRDKRIYRVTYQKHSDTPEGRPQLVCMMFGYQEASREGIRIRPFFVTADEEIDSIESNFASTSTYPFALEIHKNFKGNGVYWTSYTFVFTPTEARIIERSEGGRKIHTKTHYYDESGKIVRTDTSTSE